MAVTPSSELVRSPSGARLQVLTWQGSDEQLLELAHAGSVHAAGRLYDRFSKDVNRVVFHLMGPDSEHDDLVQETFLRVFRSISQVREAAKLSSWVVSVAVNVALSELKKRKYRRWLLAEKSKVDANEGRADDHEARQLLRSVFGVLDAMPASERTTFALRHMDERTMNEVAELMSVSLPTAKRALAKAEHRFETLAARIDPSLLQRFKSADGGGEP